MCQMLQKTGSGRIGNEPVEKAMTIITPQVWSTYSMLGTVLFAHVQYQPNSQTTTRIL